MALLPTFNQYTTPSCPRGPGQDPCGQEMTPGIKQGLLHSFPTSSNLSVITGRTDTSAATLTLHLRLLLKGSTLVCWGCRNNTTNRWPKLQNAMVSQLWRPAARDQGAGRVGSCRGLRETVCSRLSPLLVVATIPVPQPVDVSPHSLCPPSHGRVCARACLPPPRTRTPVILDRGPTLLHWDLILTISTCNNRISKKVTF